MSSLVLPESEIDLLVGDVDERCEKLIALREWVINASVLDAADTAKRATTFVRIAKAAKAASRLRIEASRLEATALRVVGLADELTLLPSHQRGTATYLASLCEEEFADLLGRITDTASAKYLFLQARQEKDRERVLDAYDRAAQGYATEEISGWSEWQIENVAEAASTLLKNLAESCDSITTEEAVTRVVEGMGLSTQVSNDPIFRQGVKQCIREAVRFSGTNEKYEISDTGEPLDVPGIVTYYEEGAAPDRGLDDHSLFLRVPWQAAGIDQLKNMVEYREQQAAYMNRKAASLRFLYELLLERQSDGEPHLVNDLLRKAAQGHRIRRT